MPPMVTPVYFHISAFTKNEQFQFVSGDPVGRGLCTNQKAGMAAAEHGGAEGILSADRQLVIFPGLQNGAGRDGTSLYTVYVSNITYLKGLAPTK